MLNLNVNDTNMKLLNESPKCEHCECLGAETRRQNTNYKNDELNFATLCEKCHELNDEYWAEMWKEYWQSVL